MRNWLGILIALSLLVSVPVQAATVPEKSKTNTMQLLLDGKPMAKAQRTEALATLKGCMDASLRAMNTNKKSGNYSVPGCSQATLTVGDTTARGDTLTDDKLQIQAKGWVTWTQSKEANVDFWAGGRKLRIITANIAVRYSFNRSRIQSLPKPTGKCWGWGMQCSRTYDSYWLDEPLEFRATGDYVLTAGIKDWFGMNFNIGFMGEFDELGGYYWETY